MSWHNFCGRDVTTPHPIPPIQCWGGCSSMLLPVRRTSKPTTNIEWGVRGWAAGMVFLPTVSSPCWKTVGTPKGIGLFEVFSWTIQKKHAQNHRHSICKLRDFILCKRADDYCVFVAIRKLSCLATYTGAGTMHGSAANYACRESPFWNCPSKDTGAANTYGVWSHVLSQIHRGWQHVRRENPFWNCPSEDRGAATTSVRQPSSKQKGACMRSRTVQTSETRVFDTAEKPIL